MIENTNTKQFYPGPILNNTLEITDFLFNDAEQIKIKHSKLNEEDILVDIDLNYPTDYEVIKVLPSDINAAEAALTASTGQIILKNINVLAGEKLTVYRVSQIIQDKDYPRTGAFPAATHEGALDYLTMQNQEQKDEIDRALKVSISTQNFEGSLPVPIPSRALKINANGTGFEMSEFDPDLVLLTTEEFKNQAQQAAIQASASEGQAETAASMAMHQAEAAEAAATEAQTAATEAVNKYNETINSVTTTGQQQVTNVQSAGQAQIADIEATGINTRATVDLDNLSTAGNNRFDEKVNKSDMVEVPTIVEVSDPSLMPSWYRVYSDGWCEQGGICGNSADISLLKPYKDTNYIILHSVRNGTTGAGAYHISFGINNITTNGFYSGIGSQETTAPNQSWLTKGYIK